MTAPDSEKGFVAFIPTLRDGLHVDTALTTDRPLVVVALTPGGVTELRRHIDRIRVDLVCYGDDTITARELAAIVRAGVQPGFTAGGQSIRRVVVDPPFPLPDPLTNEPRFYVGTTASINPVPA